MVSLRLPPTRMPATPWSRPRMTSPAPSAARVELAQALGEPADVMHHHVVAGIGERTGADDQVFFQQRGGNEIAGLHRGGFLSDRAAHCTRQSASAMAQ